MRGIRKSRCRAICMRRSGRNSPGVEFGDRVPSSAMRCCARRYRGKAQAAHVLRAFDRRMAIRCASVRAQGLRALVGDAGRMCARARSNAPAIFSKQRRGHVPRAVAERGRQDARRCRRRMARGDRLLPLLRGAGAQDADAAGDAGADRRIERTCAIAGAACSCASRRGIFRSRFSWARSTAALAAGNAVVAKPAEQTPIVAYRGGAAAA